MYDSRSFAGEDRLTSASNHARQLQPRLTRTDESVLCCSSALRQGAWSVSSTDFDKEGNA
jgi:hypothetical protein